MPVLDNTVSTEQMVAGLNIEMTTRFDAENERLMELLGIFDVEVMAAGTTLNQIKIEGQLSTETVTEGDIVPLSSFKAKAIPVGTLEVHPYRKLTTAQAILKSGVVNACVKTDSKMLKLVRQERLGDFFTYLAKGTTTAIGKTLQGALAQADAALRDKLESYGDSTERIIHFVNTFDIADYLEDTNVTVQTVYGLQYLQSFLGVTDIFITNRVAKGTVFATPVENIHIYAADFAALQQAGINYATSDSGLIGIAHQECKERTGIETYILTGMLLFAEIVDYIVEATIGDTPSTQSSDVFIENVANAPTTPETPVSTFDPDGDVLPTMQNKTEEISAFAEAHNISLSGCTNKTQMLEAIAAAMSTE